MKKIIGILVLLVFLSGCTNQADKSGTEKNEETLMPAEEMSQEMGQEIEDIEVLEEDLNLDEDFADFEEDLEDFEW